MQTGGVRQPQMMGINKPQLSEANATQSTPTSKNAQASETLPKTNMTAWIKGIFEPGWIGLNARRLKSRYRHAFKMLTNPAYRATHNKPMRAATHEFGHALVNVISDHRMTAICVGKEKLKNDHVGGYVEKAGRLTPGMTEKFINAIDSGDKAAFDKYMQQLFSEHFLSTVAGYSIQKAAYPELFQEDIVRYARRCNENPIFRNTGHDFRALQESIENANTISGIAKKSGLPTRYPQLELEGVVRNADKAFLEIFAHFKPEQIHGIAHEMLQSGKMDEAQFKTVLEKHLGKHFDWQPLKKIAQEFAKNPMRYV